jgi:3-methyl-2-oxobutanoate hydroxymethyltransferase
MEDMLGLSPRVPRFVKKFGKVGQAIEVAIREYAEDVRSRAFPTPEHTYAMQGEGKPAPERVGASPTRATKKPKNPSSK